MIKKERWGIYGGTFSPPHNGHIHAVKAFLQEMKLDRLLVIPTFIPPHKTRTESTSAEDRLAMCRLAFSFSPQIEISDMEIQREGKSYTADTLSLLAKEDRELFFLCGTDMFLTMDAWHAPETIFRLANVVYIAREDDERKMVAMHQKAEEYRQKYGAVTFALHTTAFPASSTEIRHALAIGNAVDHLISHTVLAYIKERGLYN